MSALTGRSTSADDLKENSKRQPAAGAWSFYDPLAVLFSLFGRVYRPFQLVRKCLERNDRLDNLSRQQVNSCCVPASFW
jgi:hypothetical protein